MEIMITTGEVSEGGSTFETDGNHLGSNDFALRYAGSFSLGNSLREKRTKNLINDGVCDMLVQSPIL